MRLDLIALIRNCFRDYLYVLHYLLTVRHR